MTRRKLPIATLLSTFTVFFPSPPADAVGAELTVLAGQESGDYGTDRDLHRETAVLQLAAGDETQLRVSLGYVRLDTDSGVIPTPVGPVPRRQRQGSGEGGSGAGNPQGPEADELPSETGDSTVSGLGDLRLTVSRRLLGGGAKIFRLDAEVGAKLPTADEDDALGTGEADYRLGLAGAYRTWSINSFGGVAWNVLGDPDWVELRDVLDAYVGVESEPLADRLLVSAWLEGNDEVVAGAGGRAALGIGLRGLHKVPWRIQLTTGLSGSAEDFSAQFGLAFGVATPTVGSRRIG